MTIANLKPNALAIYRKVDSYIYHLNKHLLGINKYHLRNKPHHVFIALYPNNPGTLFFLYFNILKERK